MLAEDSGEHCALSEVIVVEGSQEVGWELANLELITDWVI